jgi:transposase
MRAFDPEVVDVIWRTVEPLLPQQVETHPLGCHRPRVPGRVCFRGILIRLAHGNDVRLPTLDPIDQAGLLADIGVLHLDRGYDSPAVRDRLRVAGIDQFEIQRRGTKVPGVKRQPLRLGLRWVVEATNTWWSNYGQLRRNTDRRPRHRHAALCLATAILIVGRLIDWRNRWSPR